MIYNFFVFRKKLNELKRLKEKQKVLQERYVRLLADYDNYKKDVLNRIERAKDSEKERIFRELITIVDNFERALSFSISESSEIKRGVEMIYKQLLKFLSDYGVEQFSSKGKKFDPRFHEAISVIEGEEDDIVVEEYEKGYLYKDKILRPARVVVSKRNLPTT
jgi:molecular chaperone GrpE